MELHCPREECHRTWNYRGAKTYPAIVLCPDCRAPVKIPKDPVDEDHLVGE